MKFLVQALAYLPAVLAALGDPHSIRAIKKRMEARLNAQSSENDLQLLYPAHNISIPIDHFHNESIYEPHTNATFENQYWFDAQFYKPGGPVIIIQGGETHGSDRLPYLQKGILHELAKATNGIGVVFEHRYYGGSWPTPDLSIVNLRFLSTEQAMADQAYFARNVVFPGLEHLDLTSASVPYITYGGSYAGAFVAFLRVQYPDVFWGAISSSGVPLAIYDYWQYFSPVAKNGPPACIDAQQTLIGIIDGILIDPPSSSLVVQDLTMLRKRDKSALVGQLKDLFGLGNVTYNDDFASVITEQSGLLYWQSLNWDPAVGSNTFYEYCDIITNSSLTYPETGPLDMQAATIIRAAGHRADPKTIISLLNLVGYVNTTVQICANSGQTQDECFRARDPAFHRQDDLSQEWRSWLYQVCTEWGYLITGSGVPTTHRPLISRTIDLPYTSTPCREAFALPGPPDLARVNRYGGYDIAYPRLAFVDGAWDAWRPAGVHAFDEGARRRADTVSEPFKLIPRAGHHWDENGVFGNETGEGFPGREIREIHAAEVGFVRAWLEEHEVLKAGGGGR